MGPQSFTVVMPNGITFRQARELLHYSKYKFELVLESLMLEQHQKHLKSVTSEAKWKETVKGPVDVQDQLLTELDLDAGAVLKIPSVITDVHANWMYMEAVRHTVRDMQK